MVFVAAVTAVSLVMQIHSGLLLPEASPVERINGGVSLVFLGLASALMYFGARALLGRSPPAPAIPQ
jgi:hypothetical protein